MTFKSLNHMTVSLGAIVVALGATIGAHKAEARDYSGDLLCKMIDTRGNANYWAFNSNTENANGTLGGTFVETGYQKNGAMVTSQPGQRPIWTFTGNEFGGLTIMSNADPAYRIVIGGLAKTNGFLVGPSVLIKGTSVKARGSCTRHVGLSASEVGDQGL